MKIEALLLKELTCDYLETKQDEFKPIMDRLSVRLVRELLPNDDRWCELLREVPLESFSASRFTRIILTDLAERYGLSRVEDAEMVSFKLAYKHEHPSGE